MNLKKSLKGTFIGSMGALAVGLGSLYCGGTENNEPFQAVKSELSAPLVEDVEEAIQEPSPVARSRYNLDVREWRANLQDSLNNYGEQLAHEMIEANGCFTSESINDAEEQISGMYQEYGPQVAIKIYKDVRDNLKKITDTTRCYNIRRLRLPNLTQSFSPTERWDIHLEEILEEHEGDIVSLWGSQNEMLLELLNSMTSVEREEGIAYLCSDKLELFTIPTYKNDKGTVYSTFGDGVLCRNVLEKFPSEFLTQVDVDSYENLFTLGTELVDLEEKDVLCENSPLSDMMPECDGYSGKRSDFLERASKELCSDYGEGNRPSDAFMLLLANAESYSGNVADGEIASVLSSIASGCDISTDKDKELYADAGTYNKYDNKNSDKKY